MRTVSNPDRGCGNLREGGCYLQATFSTRGNLLPVVWTLGTHVFGGRNLFAEVPPREDIFIDPEMTIDGCELIRYPVGQGLRQSGEYGGSSLRQLQRLGDIALIDHVGMNNYTAWSFAAEVMRHGPSRRVAPKLAKQIASQLPMRIFFTADLPYFESENHRDQFIRACEIALPDDVDYVPTWSYIEWGARLDDSDTEDSIRSKAGSWHYTIPILKHLDKEKDWMDIKPYEGIYFFSWITNVCYIVPKGQSEADVPDDILEAGIEPVYAAAPGEVVER